MTDYPYSVRDGDGSIWIHKGDGIYDIKSDHAAVSEFFKGWTFEAIANEIGIVREQW